MSKFKIGDKVKFINESGEEELESVYNCNYDADKINSPLHGATSLGDTYRKEFAVISEVVGNSWYAVEWTSRDEKKMRLGFQGKYLQLIKSNTTLMSSLKEKFVMALTKEPQKTFRKADITNGDDMLTEEGQSVFLSWLLHSKYAEEFKEEVMNNLMGEEKKDQ